MAFYPQTGATILAVLAATSDEVSSGKHQVLYLHLYIWMTIFTYEVSILIQKLNFLTSIINTGIVVDASEGKVPHSTAYIIITYLKSLKPTSPNKKVRTKHKCC